jgi:hypothetical protein
MGSLDNFERFDCCTKEIEARLYIVDPCLARAGSTIDGADNEKKLITNSISFM